jgi:hypothetical protein
MSESAGLKTSNFGHEKAPPEESWRGAGTANHIESFDAPEVGISTSSVVKN